MKYLVMECHAGYAVLMDEASRFVRAANLHYEIGQTVTDPVLMTETQPRIRRSTVIRIRSRFLLWLRADLCGMTRFVILRIRMPKRIGLYAKTSENRRFTAV